MYVFSSMHMSGEQLDQYTGVAATLRFPIPEIAEIEVEVQVEDINHQNSHNDNNNTKCDLFELLMVILSEIEKNT